MDASGDASRRSLNANDVPVGYECSFGNSKNQATWRCRRLVEGSLFLSAVSLGEIQSGIELTRERDAAKASEIEVWLEQLAQSFNIILPADGAVFRSCALLMHRRPDHHLEDALIAATALTHGLTVVTRHTKDFQAFGVTLINPFASPASG